MFRSDSLQKRNVPMKKIIVIALVAVAVTSATGAVFAWVMWQDMLDQISSPYDEFASGHVLLTIQPGTSISEIAAQLVTADILSLIHI